MLQLSRPDERGFGHEVLQVSGRCGAGGFGDSDLIFGAQAAAKSGGAFLEHAGVRMFWVRIRFWFTI